MKRVVLVRLSAMGDLVHSLGAVRALREARPELALHFVTQTENAPLLEGVGLASVICHDRRGGLTAVLRTRGAMRAVEPDCAVDLQGNWKSAWIARLSGARQVLGARAPHCQEAASRVLLRRAVAVSGPRHAATVAHQLLRELAPFLPVLLPHLPAQPAELARAAAAVQGEGIDPGRPFTVLVVTAQGDPRSWPVASMAAQAGLEPQPVLWLRGPQEAEVPLPAGVASLAHARGQLRDLIALGALVARAGGRVLGPDQGATHVLAATGARTLVLFGPQDPERTAPPGAGVLLRQDGPACVPCRRRRCHHPQGPVCMAFTTAQARSGLPA